DIYRPRAPGRFPALLAFGIYNKDLQGLDIAQALPPQPAWSALWTGPLEAGDTKFLVSRGYVHVIGSPRGVGKSQASGSRQWDCYDLIEWIAAQDWRRQCRHGRHFRLWRRAARGRPNRRPRTSKRSSHSTPA